MSATTVDVAIVGAGIVGCLLAREVVARSADASVLVIDRDTVGGGTSRRSAGLHLPRGRTDRVRRMSQYSQVYYRTLATTVPGLPIRPVRLTLVAAADGAPHETYVDAAGLSPADGVPGDEIGLPAGSMAWTGEGCQYADVYALTQAIARDLRPRVAFREGVHVAGVDPDAERVVLRLSTGEQVSARHAVLAPGPWLAATAWRDLLAPLGLRVKKVVALHIPYVEAPADRVVYFQDEDAFLLPLRERGYWLYSYTCPEWDVEPDALAGGLSPGNLAEAQAILRRYAPGPAARCVSGRVFCDAYSGTGEPVVRALDARIVFAGAANGSGYRLAPAIAAEAANLLGLARSEP